MCLMNTIDDKKLDFHPPKQLGRHTASAALLEGPSSLDSLMQVVAMLATSICHKIVAFYFYFEQKLLGML